MAKKDGKNSVNDDEKMMKNDNKKRRRFFFITVAIRHFCGLGARNGWDTRISVPSISG